MTADGNPDSTDHSAAGPAPAGGGIPRPARRRRIRTLLVAVAVVLTVAGGVGLALFEPWRLWTRNTVDEPVPTVMAAGGPGRVTVPAVATMSGSRQSATGSPTRQARPPATQLSTPPTAADPPETTTPQATPVELSATSSQAASSAPASPQSLSSQPLSPQSPSPQRKVPEPTTGAPAEPQVLAEGEFVTQEHQTAGVARVLLLADGSRYLRLEGLSTSDGPDLHVALTDQQAGGDWGKYRNGVYLHLGQLKGTDGNQNYAIPEAADLSGLTSAVIWCDRFSVAFGSAPLSL